MNYIREMKAFHDWLETNDISTACVALWYALMSVNNKAGWADQFTVALSVLETNTKLTRDKIYRARNKLQDVGRIKWVSRSGGQCATYELIPFGESYIPKATDETATGDTIGDATGNATGSATGNVTGNATRDTTEITATGDATGDATGNVTGNATGNATRSATGNATITKLNETKQNKTKLNHIELCISHDIDKPSVQGRNTQNKSQVTKVTYGEFANVKLTHEEHAKLLEKFGSSGCMERIERLSEYMASKNTKYTSHYATILSWARKEGFENDNVNHHMTGKGVSRDLGSDSRDTVAAWRNRPTSDLSKFCPIDF